MRRIFKITVGIIAVVIIISLVLIPITNAVTYLNSSTGWEANNKPALFKIRVTFSYTGGDGSWVFYFASAESNVGYYSEFSGFSTAHQISSYGDWVYADYTNSPYVVNFSGSAIYDDP